MLSQVKIYNLALARLGGNQIETINAPDEDSGTATLCNRLFPLVLHSTLAAHNWGFATRRAQLAEKADDSPPAAVNCLHTYALPADCLKVIQVEGYSDFSLKPVCILRGQDLLTEVPGAVLRYVAKIENCDEWPPHFANTVVWGLAAELAVASQNDPKLQQRCGEQYLTALHEAIAIDLNQQNFRPAETPWVEER